MIHITARIHERAEIGAGVRIGRLSVVWQFASVIRCAGIGSECRIGACAIVDGSHLGDRCLVGQGAFIDPGTSIGDDVFIGPHAMFCNDAWPRTTKDGWFDMRDLISGATVVTRVESGASIGAGAIIMPGIVIGANAMIAAGAVVDGDVPANCLLRRTGRLEDIDPSRTPNRMREVL